METVILNIFDFDGTLFKSPMINPMFWDKSFRGWAFDLPDQNGLGWFQNLKGLSEPFVPLYPPETWFNMSVVEEVKKSIKEKNITILLTGRTTAFLERIKIIVDTQKLNFDYYSLKPIEYNEKKAVAQRGEDYKKYTTMAFKLQFLCDLIEKECFKKVPYLKKIQINLWDDRPKHVEAFRRFFEKKEYIQDRKWLEGIPVEFNLTLVTEGNTLFDREKERQLIDTLIQDLPEPKRPKIILSSHSVFLNPESKTQLLNWFNSSKYKEQFIKDFNHNYEDWTLKAERINFSPNGQKEIEHLQSQQVTFSIIAIGTTQNNISVQAKVSHPSIVGTINLIRLGKQGDKWDAFQWIKLESQDQFELSGTISTSWTKEPPQRRTVISSKQKKFDLGAIVRFLFPLGRRNISNIIKKITEWSKLSQIELNDSNKPKILNYIKYEFVFEEKDKSEDDPFSKLQIGTFLKKEFGHIFETKTKFLLILLDFIFDFIEKQKIPNTSLYQPWLEYILIHLEIPKLLSNNEISEKFFLQNLKKKHSNLFFKKINIGKILREKQPWLLQKDPNFILNQIKEIFKWMEYLEIENNQGNEFFILHYIESLKDKTNKRPQSSNSNKHNNKNNNNKNNNKKNNNNNNNNKKNNNKEVIYNNRTNNKKEINPPDNESTKEEVD